MWTSCPTSFGRCGSLRLLWRHFRCYLGRKALGFSWYTGSWNVPSTTPSSLEHVVRNYALHTSDQALLRDYIVQALEEDPYLEKRKEVAQEWFAVRDGTSGQRAAQAIVNAQKDSVKKNVLYKRLCWHQLSSTRTFIRKKLSASWENIFLGYNVKMKACFLKLRKLRRCKTNYGKSDYKERTAERRRF